MDTEELTAPASARIEMTDGAAGHLLVHGVVDFSGVPTLDFRYHGRLCGA